MDEKTVAVCIRMPAALHAALLKHAGETGWTPGESITSAMYRTLKPWVEGEHKRLKSDIDTALTESEIISFFCGYRRMVERNFDDEDDE